MPFRHERIPDAIAQVCGWRDPSPMYCFVDAEFIRCGHTAMRGTDQTRGCTAHFEIHISDEAQHSSVGFVFVGEGLNNLVFETLLLEFLPPRVNGERQKNAKSGQDSGESAWEQHDSIPPVRVGE